MDLLAELMNELQNQLKDVQAKKAISKNIAYRDVYGQDSIGDTQLHLVLKNLKVNENVIKQILDMGARVNATNHLGQTSLHYALKYGNCELSIVRLLVNRGADVQVGDHLGEYSLSFAVANEHCPFDVIEFLVGKGANAHALNWYVLHLALENRNISFDVIKLLLDEGADIHAVNRYGEAALNVAVCSNRKDVVKMLLEKPKIKVNLADKFSFTPLHRAIDEEINSGMVKLLLEAGADVEMETESGELALHLAALHQDPAIIKLLLDYGARVNVLNTNNMSPLYAAVCNRNWVAVKCLLDAGSLVFSDHIIPNSYPPLYRVSPLHCTIVHYIREQSEENLQRVQVLVKYALLEKTSLVFYHEVSDETKELVRHFIRQCWCELDSVCVKPNATLRQFILRLRLQENEDECQTDEILEILNANAYPIYKEVVSGLLNRNKLNNGFERHMVYTVINGPKQNQNPKCVILNNDAVCKLVEYLSDEDVLNLLLAFHKSNKNNASPMNFSIPCKTSLNEIAVKSESFFKRARIN